MVQLCSSKVQYKYHQAKIKVSVGLCPFLEASRGESDSLSFPASSGQPQSLVHGLLPPHLLSQHGLIFLTHCHLCLFQTIVGKGSLLLRTVI